MSDEDFRTGDSPREEPGQHVAPDLAPPTGGDMLKSVYDPDDDGKVVAAVAADSATSATTAATALAVQGVAGSGVYHFYGTNLAGVEGVWALPLPLGNGQEMNKDVYDTNDDGVVDAADEATAVSGVDAAGNDQYYGTDSGGNPGFYPLPVVPAHVLLIEVFAQGLLLDNETLARYLANTAFTIPSGATNSLCSAGTAATASATLLLKKNGTDFGSIDFSAAGTTGAFTVASDTSFVAGDVLTVVQSGTADATLADVSITMEGTL